MATVVHRCQTPLSSCAMGESPLLGRWRAWRFHSDAYRVDTRGKTILPGLWDMHAHFEQVEWGPIDAAAAVTTARDCGNEFEFITAVRDAIRDGRGVGPRLLLAGVVDGTSPAAAGVQRWTPRNRRAIGPIGTTMPAFSK